MKDSENEYFLGWTTTPWTLPANVALAVHPNMEYVKAKQRRSCIHCCERTCTRCIKEDYEVLSVHKGEELVNTSYSATISNEGSYKWLPRYRSRFCHGR